MCKMKDSRFGGLDVPCWPLQPKFPGSNPAKAVGFFRAKNSSARLPSEGKQSCRSHVVDLRHVKDPSMLCGSRVTSGYIYRPFLAYIFTHFAARIILRRLVAKLETYKLQGYNSSFPCLGGVAAQNWWRKLKRPIRG
jgi:hypothetical protein